MCMMGGGVIVWSVIGGCGPGSVPGEVAVGAGWCGGLEPLASA